MTARILQDAGGSDPATIPADGAGGNFAKGATVTASPYVGSSISGLGLSPAALQLEPIIGPTIQPGGDLTGSVVTGLGGSALPANIANGFLKRNNANGGWEEVAYGSAADTVCQGNDSRLSDSRIPSGTAGGDLAGSYPNPTVKASVGLTGAPTAPTAAADTNTTQIASTAFVIGQASSTTPVVDGTGAAGSSARYARGDHVHPTDTSRAPVASPTFTGIVTTPAVATPDSAPTPDGSNNIAATGLSFIRAVGTATLAHLTSPTAGQRVTIINVGSGTWTVKNNAGGAGQMLLSGAVDYSMASGKTLELIYSGGDSLWLEVARGAWK